MFAKENLYRGWTLDDLGNWTSFDDDGDTTTSTYNAANENTSYTYDHDGNLTADGTCEYTYDAWNRLVEVEDSSSDVLADYRYDGQGRLIVSAQATTTAGTLDSFTYYFYSGTQVVETRHSAALSSSPDSLAPQFQYVWSAQYVDSPIVRDENADADSTCTGAADERLYYLTDANHNVTSLVDASGAVVERYVYTPYGAATFYNSDWTEKAVQTSSVGNTRLFAGMDYDATTGLYADRARWYNPATGTFLTRDPAATDVNLYRYCHNDPTGATDPSGLSEYYGPLPFDWTFYASQAAGYGMAATFVSAGTWAACTGFSVLSISGEDADANGIPDITESLFSNPIAAGATVSHWYNPFSWPWGEWWHHFFPVAVDGVIEAAKVPVPVGPLIGALEAGSGLYGIGKVSEAQKHYNEVMGDPNSTEAQKQEATDALERAKGILRGSLH